VRERQDMSDMIRICILRSMKIRINIVSNVSPGNGFCVCACSHGDGP